MDDADADRDFMAIENIDGGARYCVDEDVNRVEHMWRHYVSC